MAIIERDDMKINFHGKEIDLSFANEITINKKQGYFDEVSVIIYSDNQYINIDAGNIYVKYKGKKYMLTEIDESENK